MSTVASSRVEAHRLSLLFDRVRNILDSMDQEEVASVAGDLLHEIPDRLDKIILRLDKASYALVSLGDEFLRGRLPLDAREEVDDSVEYEPNPDDKIASRVAKRWLNSSPRGEDFFFDNPNRREVREFAESGEISNSLRRRYPKDVPPTPEKILRKPGADEFATLNRHVVETLEDIPGLPQGTKDLPKAPVL